MSNDIERGQGKFDNRTIIGSYNQQFFPFNLAFILVFNIQHSKLDMF